MPNPFIAKLSGATQLSNEDRALLERASAFRRKVDAGQQIIGEGDEPDRVNLILEGFACRAKTLQGGERQIMALLVPGDFCDLHVAILSEMDHAIRTLSPCTLVQIPKETIAQLLSSSPALTRALWWATLVDAAVVREWLVSMGRRSSEQQMAHLFCELFIRLRAVGLTTGDSYAFPLSQEEIADVLGLSLVHVNRVVQRLRGEGLIKWAQRRITIPDFQRLAAFAGFSENYLHLGPAADLDAAASSYRTDKNSASGEA